MPGKQRLIYWDANVFLAFIQDEEPAGLVEAILEEVQRSSGAVRIVTSIITKVEVAFVTQEKINQKLDPEIEKRIDDLWRDRSVLDFVEVHDGIAIAARQLMRAGLAHGWVLRTPDAIHLASARWLGATAVFTYDDGLAKYAPLVGCSIGKPFIEQPKLPFDP